MITQSFDSLVDNHNYRYTKNNIIIDSLAIFLMNLFY